MRSKTAFTLVELLVVITIVSVLIAMLLPALSKVWRQAQLVQCESNLRQIGIGVQMYASDWRGIWPRNFYWSTDPSSFDKGTQTHYVLWQGVGENGNTLPPSLGWQGVGRTYPYLKNKKVFYCPNDQTLQGKFLKYDFNTFTIPAQTGNPPKLPSAKTNVYGSYCVRGWKQPTSPTDQANNKSGTGETSPLGMPGKTLAGLKNRAIVSCFFMCSTSDGTGSGQMNLHPGIWRYPMLYADGHVVAVPMPKWIDPTDTTTFGINGTASQTCFWIAIDNMAP